MTRGISDMMRAMRVGGQEQYSAPNAPPLPPIDPVAVAEAEDDGGGGFHLFGGFKPPNPVSLLFDLPDLWEDFTHGVQVAVTLATQVLIF